MTVSHLWNCTTFDNVCQEKNATFLINISEIIKKMALHVKHVPPPYSLVGTKGLIKVWLNFLPCKSDANRLRRKGSMNNE